MRLDNFKYVFYISAGGGGLGEWNQCHFSRKSGGTRGKDEARPVTQGTSGSISWWNTVVIEQVSSLTRTLHTTFGNLGDCRCPLACHMQSPNYQRFFGTWTLLRVFVFSFAATFRSEGVAAVTSSDIRTISSFDWHPSSTNRMLVISHSGRVADVYLRERIAMVGACDILTYSYSSFQTLVHFKGFSKPVHLIRFLTSCSG